MSQSSVDELAVEYTAEPAVERMQRWRRMLVVRLISLALTVVILIVLYLWQRDRLNDNPWALVVVYGMALLIGIGWTVGTWLGFRRTRKEVASIPPGIALRIGRQGIELAGQWQPWSAVSVVRSAKGRWPGGPLLQVARTDGSAVAIPLEQVPVLPATLDTALRAYSAGRQGLDLSTLDI